MAGNEVYQVVISARAERDAEQALRWFRDQQATAAGARWFAQLWKRIDTLETKPGRCRVAAESAELGIEVRELLVGRKRRTYRILFQIHGRVVRILRIRHSARDRLTVME